MRKHLIAKAIATIVAFAPLTVSAQTAADSKMMADYYGDLLVRGSVSGKSPCQVAGIDAARFIFARYDGVSMSTLMQEAAFDFEREIIKDAYAQPRMMSDGFRREQILSFRDKYERACHQVMGAAG